MAGWSGFLDCHTIRPACGSDRSRLLCTGMNTAPDFWSGSCGEGFGWTRVVRRKRGTSPDARKPPPGLVPVCWISDARTRPQTFEVETLSREDLSSRLILNVNVASVGSLSLPDSFITIMDTNDYSAVPHQLKGQVNERYPSAKRAVLRTGGDFPFLSRPDEVNLYLQLHLRRVGVEPRPDLLQGFTRDGSSGSSNNHEDGDGFDDHPRDNGDHSSGCVDHKMEHSESGSPNSDGPAPTSIVLGMANSPL